MRQVEICLRLICFTHTLGSTTFLHSDETKQFAWKRGKEAAKQARAARRGEISPTSVWQLNCQKITLSFLRLADNKSFQFYKLHHSKLDYLYICDMTSEKCLTPGRNVQEYNLCFFSFLDRWQVFISVFVVWQTCIVALEETQQSHSTTGSLPALPGNANYLT